MKKIERFLDVLSNQTDKLLLKLFFVETSDALFLEFLKERKLYKIPEK